MTPQTFPDLFRAFTGNAPFPWQVALYHRFAAGDFPASANIPTGLGKTSIVAVWLIALAQYPDRVPRRLVYVVNRRTVVDQTTTEVLRLSDKLALPEVAEVRQALGSLCALPFPTPETPPLAISTLRGQFPDNGKWYADPSRPAVVIGTVDMIGSGLLFSRYTRGFKTRPLHAGFLAQDVLLVHDEAHLEPSFQDLLERIVAAQRAAGDLRKLHLIELTATSRAVGAKPFGLDENPDDRDTDNKIVKERFAAVKRLSLHPLGAGEKLEATLVSYAEHRSAGRAVLVFTRSVEVAMKVAAELDKGERKGKVVPLTGTMRGRERDDLVQRNAVFQRFLPPSSRSKEVDDVKGTVYLVATSAGEVGVNFSADDLVCDLSTYESMAQRFGRLNRFGEHDDSEVVVVHEKTFDANKPVEAARERTLELLNKLGGSASPAALEKLEAKERAAAFSPKPEQRIATEIQFDAWALTSIRQPIAARPPVEPYLHGEADWQPDETHLAWRDDRDFLHIEDPEAFLDEFPLGPAELLRDTTPRVVKTLGSLLAKQAASNTSFPDAWLVVESGAVSPFKLSNFDPDNALARLARATLILPASIGGLVNGLFLPSSESPVEDVSETIRRETDRRRDVPAGHRLVQAIEISDETAEEPQFLLYLQKMADRASTRATRSESLDEHTAAVAANAAAIAAKLLPDPTDGEPDLRRCLVLAALWHDLGKNRGPWQRNLGNLDYDPARPETILAKSAPGMNPRNVTEHYRHEFGSLHDLTGKAAWATLNEAERDIVLHLVAAHHGRARPHFPADEIFDYSAEAPATDALVRATDIPRRFARLQKRFGCWGLAWLESLLRAADYAASAGLVAQSRIPPITSSRRAPAADAQKAPVATASLVVTPANPGHYFACCGLFELATRLAPDALAWFDQDSATGQWHFHLAHTPPLAELLGKIAAAEIKVLDITDNHSAVDIGPPFNLRLDWWRNENRATGKLKTWAGQMKASSILATLHGEVKALHPQATADCFTMDATPTGAVSYFDAPRAANATARDVGFSLDKLKKGGVVFQNTLHPFVEFFCLIGLQRSRPALLECAPRAEQTYAYHFWRDPLPIALLPVAVIGQLPDCRSPQYQFANPSRTQDYRAFVTASAVSIR